nr:MAG TPA: hypothetical protein [Caudoviricetes sp.]
MTSLYKWSIWLMFLSFLFEYRYHLFRDSQMLLKL